jgi:hypothetical protein
MMNWFSLQQFENWEGFFVVVPDIYFMDFFKAEISGTSMENPSADY